MTNRTGGEKPWAKKQTNKQKETQDRSRTDRDTSRSVLIIVLAYVTNKIPPAGMEEKEVWKQMPEANTVMLKLWGSKAAQTVESDSYCLAVAELNIDNTSEKHGRKGRRELGREGGGAISLQV